MRGLQQHGTHPSFPLLEPPAAAHLVAGGHQGQRAGGGHAHCMHRLCSVGKVHEDRPLARECLHCSLSMCLDAICCAAPAVSFVVVPAGTLGSATTAAAGRQGAISAGKPRAPRCLCSTLRSLKRPAECSPTDPGAGAALGGRGAQPTWGEQAATRNTARARALAHQTQCTRGWRSAAQRGHQPCGSRGSARRPASCSRGGGQG